MRGGEEDGAVDIAEVALFHVVLLGLRFEHLLFKLIVLVYKRRGKISI